MSSCPKGMAFRPLPEFIREECKEDLQAVTRTLQGARREIDIKGWYIPKYPNLFIGDADSVHFTFENTLVYDRFCLFHLPRNTCISLMPTLELAKALIVRLVNDDFIEFDFNSKRIQRPSSTDIERIVAIKRELGFLVNNQGEGVIKR